MSESVDVPLRPVRLYGAAVSAVSLCRAVFDGPNSLLVITADKELSSMTCCYPGCGGLADSVYEGLERDRAVFKYGLCGEHQEVLLWK